MSNYQILIVAHGFPLTKVSQYIKRPIAKVWLPSTKAAEMRGGNLTIKSI
ncbi:hypothetical protein [Chryseobacterium sp. CCH4-E10]|nr:hypothetical protein [Chryseobacterium sp. CCH4-E10]